MPRSFIWLVVVGVESVLLRINFDNFVGLCNLVSGLLVFLDIGVELGKEGLDTALVLNGQKASLEVLSGGRILVAVSLA